MVQGDGSQPELVLHCSPQAFGKWKVIPCAVSDHRERWWHWVHPTSAAKYPCSHSTKNYPPRTSKAPLWKMLLSNGLWKATLKTWTAWLTQLPWQKLLPREQIFRLPNTRDKRCLMELYISAPAPNFLCFFTSLIWTFWNSPKRERVV